MCVLRFLIAGANSAQVQFTTGAGRGVEPDVVLALLDRLQPLVWAVGRVQARSMSDAGRE